MAAPQQALLNAPLDWGVRVICVARFPEPAGGLRGHSQEKQNPTNLSFGPAGPLGAFKPPGPWEIGVWGVRGVHGAAGV